MLDQCWATVYDIGPTLGQCLVFAGIQLLVNYTTHMSQLYYQSLAR